MEKVAAIIQARLGSTRLPGKALLRLGSKPVIQWVCERTAMIEGINALLVATTTSPEDDSLVDLLEKLGVPAFRGSHSDVLDRYLQAARFLQADVIVRITADCPLLDPQQSSRVVAALLADRRLDYASNIEPRLLPDGLDTEAVRFGALRRLAHTVTEPRYREHVTLYIREHPEQFRCSGVLSSRDLSNHRWTLDYLEDFQFLSSIVAHLDTRQQVGHLHEILDILTEHPELAKLNAEIATGEARQQ